MTTAKHYVIIDSHTHWGPSITMGMTVPTKEILNQAESCGIQKVVIFPFPSTAIEDEAINEQLLTECRRESRFIPYYYIPEDLRPIPPEKGYKGGKWHWMRGVQDAASNYRVLEDPGLDSFIGKSESVGLPIVFEEELAFTRAFVSKTSNLKLIIPHLGLLGGNPRDFLAAFRDRASIYFDTALASQGNIMDFVKEVGAERILFGSDIPFGTMRSELDKILALNISDKEKALILSGNLRRLAGIENLRPEPET
jgi:predicted TIM-barrel fold metal-dependent hydrolase